MPKILSGCLLVVCLFLLGAGLFTAHRLPTVLFSDRIKPISLSSPLPMVATADPLLAVEGGHPQGGTPATVKLFGVVPIGSTHIKVVEEDSVVLGGSPFGIKILAEGVLVVGFSPVSTATGTVNPAKEAGLKEGDLVLSVAGRTLATNGALMTLVEESGGAPLTVVARRDNKTLTVTVTPVLATDGHYRVGMWVRDSTAGLGTMTFYHPATGTYGGLGHAVCDPDTGNVMSLLKGEIVGAKISGLNKATAGSAGELRGCLLDGQKIGSIEQNGIHGVYGNLHSTIPSGQVLPVARKQEITIGEATLYTTIENEVCSYTCRIEKINYKESDTHNMVVRVTDSRLLSKTGGIVQGMSGSPIVQNRKLIGAVTHVFVNTPEKGYALFAETMLEVAKSIPQTREIKNAS